MEEAFDNSSLITVKMLNNHSVEDKDDIIQVLKSELNSDINLKQSEVFKPPAKVFVSIELI